jgi:nitrate/nitrite transporter NarK
VGTGRLHGVNAFATGAWTAAYPSFAELFPTHLRAAGMGLSVGVGRLGAAYDTLYLPDLAARLGPTISYLLIAGFWALGLIAIIVWSITGGRDGAHTPLEVISGPGRARRSGARTRGRPRTEPAPSQT